MTDDLEKESIHWLTEFEDDSTIGLAQFEDESATMLDELKFDQSNMLEEFENSLDIILSDEAIPGEEAIDEETETRETDKVAGDETTDPSSDSDEQIIEVVEPEESIIEIENPVIGFICGEVFDPKTENPFAHIPNLHLIPLPCAGMLKMAWVKKALEKGAGGVFVVSCGPGHCEHSTGSCLTQERWTGARRPMLLSKVDDSRVRLFQFYPSDKEAMISSVEAFILQIRNP
ncbi:MAG TPA: hydrogenase iron-sulfur subunit [bacterium]|jgi:coenzyme F420-reducing hydrogenase delta subunit